MDRYDTHDGITLRPLTGADTDAHFHAVSASLPTLSQWLPWARAGYAREDSARWIAQCLRAADSGAAHHFGVFDVAAATLLGAVGLSHVNRVRRCANLGYWVADAARGREVAVTAARLAAAWGFERLALQRIEILVHPDNQASLRVAIKLGAVCEGVARNGILVDDIACEAIVHSLIPRDLDVPPHA